MSQAKHKEGKMIRCMVYRIIHEANGDSSIVIGNMDVRRPHLVSSVEIRFDDGHSFKPGQEVRVTIEAV
jgi:hypothetical protein